MPPKRFAFDEALFRALWSQPDLVVEQIASIMGMCASLTREKAVDLMLPPRRGGRPVNDPPDDGKNSLLAVLYRSKMRAVDIAPILAISPPEASRRAARLGLVMRRPKRGESDHVGVLL